MHLAVKLGICKLSELTCKHYSATAILHCCQLVYRYIPAGAFSYTMYLIDFPSFTYHVVGKIGKISGNRADPQYIS